MTAMFQTRRTALASIAALPAAAPAAETATLVPAFSMYGMKDVPLAKGLDHLAKTGYRAVELACLAGWEADPESLSPMAVSQLAKLLQASGMAVAALMLDVPIDAPEVAFQKNQRLLAKACALAKSLQPGSPPLLETVVGGKPGDLPAKLPLFRERLAKVAAVLEREGGTLALKPHRMQAFDDASALSALIAGAKSPRVVAVFDPSHFQHRMPGIPEAWKALAAQTRFVHVKETVIDGKQSRFVLPGDGGLDLAMMRALLLQGGYKGSVCVEVSRQVWAAPGYDPFTAATKSFTAIRKIVNG
jgi:inosose dehydratase